MKHFVVLNDWAFDGESDVEVVAVRHSLEEAKEAFAARKQEELDFASTENLTIGSDEETEFEAYRDGAYSDCFTYLWIQEVD